jgi:hypothetical protein
VTDPLPDTFAKVSEYDARHPGWWRTADPAKATRPIARLITVRRMSGGTGRSRWEVPHVPGQLRTNHAEPGR